MRQRAEQLARKREQLVARADGQRAQLSEYWRRLEPPAQLAAGVFGLVNSVRRSPLLITGLGLLLLKTPWRRLARAPLLIWRGWSVLNFVRRLIR